MEFFAQGDCAPVLDLSTSKIEFPVLTLLPAKVLFPAPIASNKLQLIGHDLQLTVTSQLGYSGLSCWRGGHRHFRDADRFAAMWTATHRTLSLEDMSIN